MRHLYFRQRSRFIAALAALFILCSALYLKGQWRVLRRELGPFVERELARTLNGRVSIGSVEGGLLNAMVLKGLKIGWDFKRVGVLNFEGRRVRLNYTLWDMLSQKFVPFRPSRFRGVDISVEEGSIFFGAEPVVTNLSGRVEIDKGQIRFEQMQAQAFNLALDIEGRVWGLEGNPEPKIDFRLSGDEGDLRGLLYIANTLSHPHLSGAVKSAQGWSSGFVGFLNLGSPGVILVDNFLIRGRHLASGWVDIAKKNIFLGIRQTSSGDKRISTQTAHSTPIKQGPLTRGSNSGITQSVSLGPYSQNSSPDLVVNAASTLEGGAAYEMGTATNSPSQKNTIELFCDFSQPGRLLSYARLNHLSIGRFDIVTELQLEAELRGQALSSRMLQGKVTTFNTILNYKPFEEMAGEFLLQDGRSLKIPSLRWGDAYMLSGEAKLRPRIDVELDLNIKEGDLKELFLLSEFKGGAQASGSVDGQIHISGPLADLKTNGRLNFTRGNLGQIYYESANINLVGSGPILELRDSRILREDGYLDLSGKFDARGIFGKNGLEGLELKPDQESIMWKGWDITRPAESPELKLRKRVDEEFQVTFKGYLNYEQSWDEPASSEEFGVEYKLGQTEKVKMQLRKDEEFFSLEHKLKF